ncbi:MAG: hypothetical protein ACFBSF_09665 [Leptolyngbyaceae cyanobacterium]
MTLSRTLLRRLRRMAIPGLAATISAALAVAITLFSNNTITLNFLNNWFNNWFNKSISIGDVTITLETAPDASEPGAQPDIRVEPVITINLPEIAFNPEIGVNPEFNPTISVDPEFNPDISIDIADPVNLDLTGEPQPDSPALPSNEFTPSFNPTFNPTFDPTINLENRNQVDLNQFDLQPWSSAQQVKVELKPEFPAAPAVLIEEPFRPELAQSTVPVSNASGPMSKAVPASNPNAPSGGNHEHLSQVDSQHEDMGVVVGDRPQPESESREVLAQSPALPGNHRQHAETPESLAQADAGVPSKVPFEVPMVMVSSQSPNQADRSVNSNKRLPTDTSLPSIVQPATNADNVRPLSSEPSIIAFADAPSQELPEAPLPAGLAMVGLAFWLPRQRRQVSEWY